MKTTLHFRRTFFMLMTLAVSCVLLQPKRVDAQNSGALVLSRSAGQFLSAPNSPSLSITNDLTIETWIKLASQPTTGSYTIVSKSTEGTGQESFGLRYLFETNYYKLDAWIYTSPHAFALVNIPVGQWTHIALVYSASAGTIAFYTNGVQVGSTVTGLPNSIYAGSAPFLVGAYDNGASTTLFDGKIDEVRVWSIPRTAQQITSTMYTELTGSESGLRAYWKFDGLLTDSTTNANTLTNNNAAVMESNDLPFSANTTWNFMPCTVVTFAGQAGVSGSTDGIGTNATFNYPTRLAADNAGNIYVEQDGSQPGPIRKITPAGVVTSFGTYSFPRLATDGAGNLYALEGGLGTVKQITPSGSVTTILSGNYLTGGIAADRLGTVYVSDSASIYKVTSGTLTTFANSLPGPTWLAVDSQTNIYTACNPNNTIFKILPGGAATIWAGAGLAGSTDGTGTNALFNGLGGIAVNIDGSVCVADSGNNTIRMISTSGLVSTIAGMPGVAGSSDGAGTSARFNDPAGIAFDRFGTLYVADRTNQAIRKVLIAPSFTEQPADAVVPLGTNAAFEVSASGAVPLYYQWFFNSSTILNGQTNATLVLSNVTIAQMGSYSVLVSNFFGSVLSSNAYLTVLDESSPLGDGIPNWWKAKYHLSLTDPTISTNHPAGDQMTYLEKYLYSLNPLTADTDGDGISDYDEVFVYHSNPLSLNTSGDSIPDGWKVQYGFSPLVSIANDQITSTGITYGQLYQFNIAHTNQLDPRNPFPSNSASIFEALNPGNHTNRYYYDKEDRLLGVEYSKGISIGYIYDGNGNPLHQSVLSRTDETNGLPVLWRFLNGITNSNPYADSDGDGWSDYQEWKAGTDPNDPSSVPNVLGNPGANIASVTVPFTPSNYVVGTGQLDGVGSDEIVIGADGNPGPNNNFLTVLTQTATNWASQQINVGQFGVTSIAVGQVTNRPSRAIYVGLRATNGIGEIMEFVQSSNTWASNVVVTSANDTANVLGVRQTGELMCSYSTNGIDAGLYSLVFSSNSWVSTSLSTNRGDRVVGTQGTVWSRVYRDAAVRLVNTNQIEIVAGDREAVKNNLFLPTNWAFNPLTSKYYFQSTNKLTWYDGESFAQQYSSHLVTINGEDENIWVATNFPTPNWIGLYMTENTGGSAGNIYGQWISSGQPPNIYYYTYHPYWEADPFSNFQLCSCPNPVTNGVVLGLHGNSLWNCILPTVQYNAIVDATTVQTYSNRWLVAQTSTPPVLHWQECQVASGRVRTQATNSSSLVSCFIADNDGSGNVSAGDQFNFVEYAVSGDAVSLLTSTNFSITSTDANSYGVAVVDFLGTGAAQIFTGEPNGKLYAWSANDTTNALQRQLFTSDFSGKAWHALTAVKLSTVGEGLAGLLVDPTNQNLCKVMFWAPQSVLSSPQTGVVETAPSAMVLPSPNALGAVALITNRIWDAEGNSSTPFVQYQLANSSNWQNATITAIDGLAYAPTMRVSASPIGVNHEVTWNVMNDLGTAVVTNVYLRARAQDFMLVGDWSVATPFQINMVQDSNTNGIPDWWEYYYFGSLQSANGDFDGDGISNYAEYVADTNPTDATSFPRLLGLQVNAGTISVQWEAGTQSKQIVEKSDSLTNPNWIGVWTNLPTTPNHGSFTGGFSTTNQFYRVRFER